MIYERKETKRWSLASRGTLVFCALFLFACGALAADQTGWRTWKDSSSRYQTRAKYVTFKDGKVYLEKEDGQVVGLRLENLSAEDQEVVRRLTGQSLAESGNPAPGGEDADIDGATSNTVEFGNLLGVPARASSPDSALREVVVTGVGIEAEEAERDAFRRAIEQTVGVLVDAETIVRNDQIIKDQVLTFSRAYVQRYDVVKRGREDDLYQVTIRATVAIDRLVEKLKATDVVLKEMSGLLMARQAEHEVKSDENAADIFAKAMGDFRIDKLAKVELIGKPEVVDKDETHARVKVSAKLIPDEANWKKFSASIRPVLSKLAVSKSVCSQVVHNRWGDGTHGYSREWHSTANFQPRISDPPLASLASRLHGSGLLVGLFVSADKTGEITRWDLYRVPKTLHIVLDDLQLPKYRMVYLFLDANDVAIQQERSKDAIGGKPEYPKMPWIPGFGYVFPYQESGYFLSPIMWTDHSVYAVHIYHQVVVEIELSKLSKMTKCVAYLEEAKEGP